MSLPLLDWMLSTSTLPLSVVDQSTNINHIGNDSISLGNTAVRDPVSTRTLSDDSATFTPPLCAAALSLPTTG